MRKTGWSRVAGAILMAWVMLGAVENPGRTSTEVLPAVAKAIPGHSHNDYYRGRPLLDALDAGCISLEADVYEMNGELLIGHDLKELSAKRTLESMYLQPLQELATKHKGILPEGQPLILLVDFKTPADRTYPALLNVLEKYRDNLHRVEGGKRISGAVRIVITGDRPMEEIASAQDRLVDLDGRPGEMPDASAEVVPMQSANWKTYFSPIAAMKMTPEQQAKLHELVQDGHAKGRLVRFWAMPDNEAAWELALASGIDLVNTDQPKEFAAYYQKRLASVPTTP